MLPTVSMKLKVAWCTWNADAIQGLRPYLLISWPIGIWPLQDHGIFSTTRVCLAVTSQIVFLYFLFNEISRGCSSADDTLMETLTLITSGTLACLKIIVISINMRKLHYNYSSALRDYENMEHEEFRLIVTNHSRLANRICLGFVYFAYVTTAMFIIGPLLGGKVRPRSDNNFTSMRMELPIPVPCTIDDLEVSNFFFVTLYVAETFTLLTTTTGNLGSDALLIAIVIHVCGQVEVLKKKFDKYSDSTKQVNTYSIEHLIKRHQELFNLSNALIETINYILLIQLFVSCLVICILGFQSILALKLGNTGMIGRDLAALSTILTQLLAYSYAGEYLKNQMEGIGYSAYSVPWYDESTNLTKSITFIIMRSMHPVQLTAGNYIVVNMETYMSIVKTSVSYLSVLRIILNT